MGRKQPETFVNHSEIVSFLWGVADLIRDTFKRGKYQDVILPLTVLRRLDCVLAGTKERVLKRQTELRGKGLQDLDAQLRRAFVAIVDEVVRRSGRSLLVDLEPGVPPPEVSTTARHNLRITASPACGVLVGRPCYTKP